VREIRIPAQGDPPGVGLHQGDGPVDPCHTVLVAGDVAGAVHQIEDFLGVGQTHYQRMVTPHSLVREPQASFAFAIGSGNGAIHIEEGLLQKPLRLLLPDPHPRPVETFLQGQDVLGPKAASEISGGGRVRNALRPQPLQEVLVLTAQFDVLQAHPASQNVIGEVQDVVALVIGQMDLEQV
jgi:hypothetical protein